MSDVLLSQIENQIATVSYDEKLSLLFFIANKLNGNNQVKQKKVAKRVLGGLEKGFWIADDFDETPECFKEYL